MPCKPQDSAAGKRTQQSFFFSERDGHANQRAHFYLSVDSVIDLPGYERREESASLWQGMKQIPRHRAAPLKNNNAG
jgi:hypothetical protein